MIRYRCDVCGQEVSKNGLCKAHPEADVRSVKVTGPKTIRLFFEEGASEWRKAADRALGLGNAPEDADEVLSALWHQGYADLTIDESNAFLEWAASLSGWEDGEEYPIRSQRRLDVCGSCGAEYLEEHAEPGRLNEEEWARISVEHLPSCLWVKTRAYTREEILN